MPPTRPAPVATAAVVVPVAVLALVALVALCAVSLATGSREIALDAVWHAIRHPDDGSRDATATIATSAGAVVVRHARNRGKSAALASGARRVAEEDRAAGLVAARPMLFVDADLEDSAAKLAPLVPPVVLGQADLTIANLPRQHTPGGGLIILDEATRALPREELVRFHALLRRVVAEGTSVLMVSHNLEEVLALADRVTVLRDGTVTGAGLRTAELTEPDMARLMLGRTVGTLRPRGVRAANRPVVAEVTGLSGDGVADVSLTIHEGEVVGLTTSWAGPPG